MALVSIVIPTRNAGSGFRQTLEALFQQRFEGETEVTVIDSGSTDGTLELCRAYPVDVMRIPPQEFSHSRTRNLGISHSSGEFVVLLVQDALPADAFWLYNLIQPLQEDSLVASVYSRQVPRPDADLFTRRMLSMWGVSSRQPLVRQIRDWAAYNQLPWEQKAHFCAFSNVSSAIRTSVWREIPFPNVEYAEDLAWARTVLERGYRVVYVPDSVVVHSHQRSWMEKLQRAYVDGEVVPRLFNADLLFPGDEALETVANLLYRELQGSNLYWAAQAVCLTGSRRVERLSSRSIAFILSESSPWMPGVSVDRKKETLLNTLVGKIVGGRRWQGTLYRGLGLSWIRFLSLPAVDRMLYRTFLRHYACTLAQVWEPWILLWAMLSAPVNAPLPPEFTNWLLSYFKEFLPAPEEELPNIWLNVLVGIGGRFLGRAAWAAASQGRDSEMLRRIERWVIGELSRP